MPWRTARSAASKLTFDGAIIYLRSIPEQFSGFSRSEKTTLNASPMKLFVRFEKARGTYGRGPE